MAKLIRAYTSKIEQCIYRSSVSYRLIKNAAMRFVLLQCHFNFHAGLVTFSVGSFILSCFAEVLSYQIHGN